MLIHWSTVGGDIPVSPYTAAFGVYLPTPKKYRQALLCTALIHLKCECPQITYP